MVRSTLAEAVPVPSLLSCCALLGTNDQRAEYKYWDATATVLRGLPVPDRLKSLRLGAAGGLCVRTRRHSQGSAEQPCEQGESCASSGQWAAINGMMWRADSLATISRDGSEQSHLVTPSESWITQRPPSVAEHATAQPHTPKRAEADGPCHYGARVPEHPIGARVRVDAADNRASNPGACEARGGKRRNSGEIGGTTATDGDPSPRAAETSRATVGSDRVGWTDDHRERVRCAATAVNIAVASACR